MTVVIIGASSGIGRQIAEIYARRGAKLWLCARRQELLRELAYKYPGQVAHSYLDVNAVKVGLFFFKILCQAGKVDLIINCVSIGEYTPEIDLKVDHETVITNCHGFAIIADLAVMYLEKFCDGRGQFAAITSIAGVRTIGVALSYSASKRFQTAYLEGLEQVVRLNKLDISITDIRPGFVDTDLLDKDHNYPMKMSPEKVARAAVRAIDRRRRVAIIDWRYRILVALWRLIPRALWIRLPIHLK